METRKIMFAVLALICAVSLAVTSCKDKKRRIRLTIGLRMQRSLLTGHLIKFLIKWKWERIV